MSNRTDLERDRAWKATIAAAKAVNVDPGWLAFVDELAKVGMATRRKIIWEKDNRTDDEKDRDEYRIETGEGTL